MTRNTLRSFDTRERHVIVDEQLAKRVIVLENNQRPFGSDSDEIKPSLSIIHSTQMSEVQNISVILDRSIRMRRGDYLARVVEPKDKQESPLP